MNQYLLNPFIQVQDKNGLSIVGAKIYVYDSEQHILAETYSDFNGTLNTNPVITDTLGNATIIADDSKYYDVSITDADDNLLFTKKYIKPNGGSSPQSISIQEGEGIDVSVSGNTYTISVDNNFIPTFDDLSGYQEKLIGGNNIEITNANIINVTGRRQIATQEPITATLGNSTLVIGFNDSAYATKEYVDSAISSIPTTSSTTEYIWQGFANEVNYQDFCTTLNDSYAFASGKYPTWVEGCAMVSSDNGHCSIFPTSSLGNSANIPSLGDVQNMNIAYLPISESYPVNFIFSASEPDTLRYIAVKGASADSVFVESWRMIAHYE